MNDMHTTNSPFNLIVVFQTARSYSFNSSYPGLGTDKNVIID